MLLQDVSEAGSPQTSVIQQGGGNDPAGPQKEPSFADPALLEREARPDAVAQERVFTWQVRSSIPSASSHRLLTALSRQHHLDMFYLTMAIVTMLHRCCHVLDT